MTPLETRGRFARLDEPSARSAAPAEPLRPGAAPAPNAKESARHDGMHVLILGGSPAHPGGVEAFCDRSKEALERRGGWRIHRIPTDTAYLNFRRLPALARGLAGLFRYRRQRPDCVWLQYVTLPDLVYLLAARLLGLKVMVTPHLGSNWRSQSNPMLRTLSGWMLSFAHRLALISKTQELEIRLPPAVPRSLIRNFLPADILASRLPDPGTAAPELQLIHSGRLSEGKGTFLFVDVCRKLHAAGVPFFARITGGADKETRVRLDTMIAEAKLRDRVAVLGRVPDAELLELLGRSDVLLHLSRIDSYPLIVLESMACVMFPVCMDLAGARDMVATYDGHIVSERTAVDEAVAFLAGLDLADIRSRSRAAAVRVRADYHWDACVQAVASALVATRGREAIPSRAHP